MLGRNQNMSLVQRFLLYAFLAIVGAVMAYPFFFMVTTSLKDWPRLALPSNGPTTGPS